MVPLMMFLSCAGTGLDTRASAAPPPSSCPTFTSLATLVAATPRSGTVRLACSRATTITFTHSIRIESNVTIDGTASREPMAFDGRRHVQLFVAGYGVNLRLEGLRLVNGWGPCAGDGGGAVYSDFGTLTVLDSTFGGDRACRNGGAVSIAGGDATIAKSRFLNNSAPDGGAIYVTGRGELTLRSTAFGGNLRGGAVSLAGAGSSIIQASSFTRNSSRGGNGGAINVAGSPTTAISNSTFSGNSATPAGSGGALYVAGPGLLNVETSNFLGNSSGNGGAIFLSGVSTSQIDRSTIAGNSTGVAGAGGGLYVTGASEVRIANSTFSANSAGTRGGGAMMSQGGSVAVSNSTVWGNRTMRRGGAIAEYGTRLTFDASIIAASRSSANCFLEGGHLVDNGYNLTDRRGSCTLNAPTNLTTLNPRLEPLRNYGAPTQTMALKAQSPAIGRIPRQICPPVDERGMPRPAKGHVMCDIGAYEYGSRG